jgi:hypothetical protein
MRMPEHRARHSENAKRVIYDNLLVASKRAWNSPEEDMLTDELPDIYETQHYVDLRSFGTLPRAAFIDIAIPHVMLAVEVDGSVHHDRKEYDQERTRRLESLGWKVIRFWNSDVIRDARGCADVVMNSVRGLEASNVLETV